jgi:hypothetical protein
VRLRTALKQLSQASVLALFFCTSCGLLGDKDDKDKTTKLNQSTGCLDQMGPLFTSYLKGEVDATEWTETWTCVDETLETFTQYVRGSAKDAFTQDDIRVLVSRFILTGKPITKEFISGLFSLKATLFGGSDQFLTKTEVTEFRRVAMFLKNRSVSLIPKIWNYRNATNRKNLDDFASALASFSEDFVNELKVKGNAPLSRDQALLFLTELGRNSSLEMDATETQELIDLFFGVKVMLLSGTNQSISSEELLQVLRIAGDLGGRAIVLDSDDPSEDTSAKLTALISVEKTFLNAAVRWGGKIPFTAFESILDVIPNRWLPTRAEDFKEGFRRLFHPRTEVIDNKETRFPSAFSVLFKNFDSTMDGFLYSSNITESVSEVRQIIEDGRILEQVFKDLKRELTPTEFAVRLKSFAANRKLDFYAPHQINRLIKIGQTFPGLFTENSSEMRFNGITTQTRSSLSRLSWIERAGRRVLEAYGSFDDANNEPLGDIKDLLHLIGDVNPVLMAISLVHPDAKDVHIKRFREINLFMSVSNGDAFADINEVTEYISYLMSSSRLGSKAINALFREKNGKPALCEKIGWDDKVQLPIFDIHCFRREFQANFETIYEDFPILLSTFKNSSDAEKKSFFEKLEAAAKVAGYNDDPIGEFDISNYSGIAHYVESVMLRFDRAGGAPNGTLNRAEVLDDVFPIFERELSGISNIKIRIVNKALLLFLMQNGRSPFACPKKPTAKEIKNLVGWLLSGGPFKSFAASRLKVYAIFGELSASGGACGSSSESDSGSLEEILEYFPSEL